ncbi:hypothetical protein [Nocardioides convexus]|nr:hypothetical protein [Nocardioides convexus]
MSRVASRLSSLQPDLGQAGVGDQHVTQAAGPPDRCSGSRAG